jgi:hypothetical protein
MDKRDGIYFVNDSRVEAPPGKGFHLGAICHVSFSGKNVFIVSASQHDDYQGPASATFDHTQRAPAYETFEDRHAFRTPDGEVLLIWPTAQNFKALVDHALADISTGDYAFPSEAELATDEGRQHFLRQFVEA